MTQNGSKMTQKLSTLCPSLASLKGQCSVTFLPKMAVTFVTAETSGL
jgi:hypothetical protein